MSLSLPSFLEVFAPQSTVFSGGHCYIAYPSRSNVRWLVPRAGPFHRSGLDLCRPHSILGWSRKILMTYGISFSEKMWLDAGALSELETLLARKLNVSNVKFAVCVGTPGAYQKGTLQIMADDGAVIAFAKLADQPLARAAIKRERHTLQRLTELPKLFGLVPALIDWFDWRDNTVLVISAGPRASGPSRFSTHHTAFLIRLQEATNRPAVFSQSPMWNRAVNLFDELKEQSPDDWKARWDRALYQLDETLGNKIVPLSLAHRDFAPWNIRLGPAGVFVFDWECAEDGVTPLYDAFHFFAIKAALASRNYLPNKRQFSDLLSALPANCTEFFYTLYLAYLTDMSFYYGLARANAPDAGNDQVYSWLGQQIDRNLMACHAPS